MKEIIEFEEDDIIGETTLNVIAEANKFNRWMYETIKPFCKGKVLEIGSGIGNISDYFMQDDFEILLTDIRQGYCEKLKSKFSENKCFLGTEIMDLTDPDFDIKFENHLEQYDTVFALNVVEHIYDDTLALKNCKKLLKKDGHLIILVPSYQKLFNNFDTELGHYRRYTKASLSTIFLNAKFDIIKKRYFNFIGIFGWYVSGNLLKRKSIPGNQMSLFNILVPIFKIVDLIIFRSIGLSTILIGKKKS